MSFDTVKCKKNLYANIFASRFSAKNKKEKRRKRTPSPIINKWLRFDFDVSGIPVIMPGGDVSIFYSIS